MSAEKDKSPTPETDAAQFGTGRVSVDFARKLERERNQYRRDLELIAEDCEAWLNNQCDETACEFIKAVRDYAKEASK
jgi:hypothetical protein